VSSIRSSINPNITVRRRIAKGKPDAKRVQMVNAGRTPRACGGVGVLVRQLLLLGRRLCGWR
jgi:hypothetical protein